MANKTKNKTKTIPDGAEVVLMLFRPYKQKCKSEEQ